jgi:hypothetical protein
MTPRILRVVNLAFITLVLLVLSCQNDENVSPIQTHKNASRIFDNGKVSIQPVTDPRIKAAILDMANGRTPTEGRTEVLPPEPLPSGYDYGNLQQMTISGTNWVTYIALSTTVNSEFQKEMVGFYFQNGVLKNYMLIKWTLIEHPTNPRVIVRYYFSSASPYYNQAIIYPNSGLVNLSHIYSPSECQKSVGLCIQAFYFSQGYLGYGLYLASFYFFEIPVGVVGGCMLGCAVHGPIDDCHYWGLC